MEAPNWENREKTWLDGDHYIRWTTYEGEVIGGILGHRTARPDVAWAGWCEGAFYFKGNAFNLKHGRKSDEWAFNGNFELPTLSPSFLCHCKECHCFIRDGKWVDAGCRHPREAV